MCIHKCVPNDVCVVCITLYVEWISYTVSWIHYLTPYKIWPCCLQPVFTSEKLPSATEQCCGAVGGVLLSLLRQTYAKLSIESRQKNPIIIIIMLWSDGQQLTHTGFKRIWLNFTLCCGNLQINTAVATQVIAEGVRWSIALPSPGQFPGWIEEMLGETQKSWSYSWLQNPCVHSSDLINELYLLPNQAALSHKALP